VQAAPVQSAIDVERDTVGLQLAVRELFEETFAEESVRATLEQLADDAEARERVMAELPQRTLSPGYYGRGAYLLELDAAIGAGVQYSAQILTRSDVMGLLAIKRARAEFERDHPGCPRCGARQDNRFTPKCRRCQLQLMGGAN